MVSAQSFAQGLTAIGVHEVFDRQSGDQHVDAFGLRHHKSGVKQGAIDVARRIVLVQFAFSTLKPRRLDARDPLLVVDLHDEAGCVFSSHFSRYRGQRRGSSRYDEGFGFATFMPISHFDTGIADVEAENERVHGVFSPKIEGLVIHVCS